MVALVTKSEVQRKLAAAENLAVQQRNYRRARDRALAKLSQNHREEYLELLAKEKEADEQEGKRWNYAINNGADLWTNVSRTIADTDRGDTSDNSQDESDNE